MFPECVQPFCYMHTEHSYAYTVTDIPVGQARDDVSLCQNAWHHVAGTKCHLNKDFMKLCEF